MDVLARVLLVVVGLAGLPWPGAWAWAPGAGRVIGGADDVAAIAVGVWRGEPAVVVTGAGGTWVVDPVTGDTRERFEDGGAAVALVDHDGDGVSDLAVCGERGVYWRSGAALREGASLERLVEGPCAALGWTRRGDGARALVVAGPEVVVWRVGATGALDDPEVVATMRGVPLLAAAPERFAVAERGASRVLEVSARGTSSLVARDAVTSLAAGPRSWAWTLASGEVEEATRRRSVVDRPATSVLAVDLRGTGTPTLIAVHADAISVLYAGAPRTFLLERTIRAIAVADATGDGCADVATLGAGVIAFHRGRCDPVDAPWVVAGSAVDVTLDGSTHPVEAFVGHPARFRLIDPTGDAGRFHGRGGPEGLVIGEDGYVTYVPEAGDEGRWTIHVRMWGGPSLVRVVPLHLVVRPAAEWVAPPETSEDAYLDLGAEWPMARVVIGQTLVRRLRDPDGARERFLVRGGPSGLRVRRDGHVGYLARAADVGTWQVRVRGWRPGSPMRAGFVVRVEPSGDDPGLAADVPRVRGYWELQACTVAFGAAVGLSAAPDTWQSVGRAAIGSGSPALALICEGGAPRAVQFVIGGESAPLYSFPRGGEALGVHTLVGTFGLTFGSMQLRAGPYVSAGIMMVGAGLRASWLPFVNRGGLGHGFEVRVGWLASGVPSGQAMVLYGWRFPRPVAR